MDYSMLSCFVYLAVHPHRFSHSWPCLPESPDTKSLPHLVTSLHPYFPFSKSLPHNLFADPHPLTPVESYRFKNSGGGGPDVSHPPSISPLAATLMGLLASVPNKRLTTCLSPLDATLTKNRGGYIFQAKSQSLFRQTLHPFLISLPPYFITSRAAPGAAVSPASGRRWRW